LKPDGHFGLDPLIFLVILPLTQLIDLVTIFFTPTAEVVVVLLAATSCLGVGALSSLTAALTGSLGLAGPAAPP
jgi:hypothetical protein